MTNIVTIDTNILVKAFNEGKDQAEKWENPETIASGIRVPQAIGDFLVLQAIRESKGTAIAVTDDEILECLKEISETEGILPCPEGGATLAALKKLKKDNKINPEDKIILFNTGTGLKYIKSLKRFLL